MVCVYFVKTERYLTDLTDSHCFINQHLVPAAKLGGRPRSLDMRLVVEAILFGRHKDPTAGNIASQTVKTGHTPAGVRGRGFGLELHVSSGLTAPIAALCGDGLRDGV